MQSLDTDVQSLGGNGGYGFGGNSMNNPLLWLITLGFLGGNRGGFFGGNNGESAAVASNAAKLDCLQQGQTALGQALMGQSEDFRFQNMTTNINNLSEITRDTQDTIFRETSALQRQLSDCCCRLEVGQKDIQTAIVLQTNELAMNQNSNTQKILDALCNNQIEALRTDNQNLRSNLNKAEIIAACAGRNGPPGPP